MNNYKKRLHKVVNSDKVSTIKISKLELIVANRSYLYSVDKKFEEIEKQNIIGLSEWNYDIPLLYKILLSCDPQICKSPAASSWESFDNDDNYEIDENCAILADFEGGILKLKEFSKKITHHIAQKLFKEAIDFLQESNNRQKYFLLDLAEIYEMNDGSSQEQNQELIAQIRSLDNYADEVVTKLAKYNPERFANRNWLGKLFSPKIDDQELEELFCEELGLGNWHNELYYSC